MPGEQIPPPSTRPTRTGLHLFPCGVVTGVEAPAHDDRLIGAQSALNRVQVWLGDFFIELRSRRRLRSTGAGPTDGSNMSLSRSPELPADHWLGPSQLSDPTV